MSHFTVLVIGENPEEQLQPYHEFECTGTDDQYVQDIDITDEKREEYESDTVTRLKNKGGDLFEPWDARFYREPTEEEQKTMGSMCGTGCGGGISWSSRDWNDGQGYRAKVNYIPDEYEEVELSRKDIMSFLEYITDYDETSVVESKNGNVIIPASDDYKFGYCVVDGDGEVIKVINRTNPDRKWDWYQLGGRWNGTLKLKEDCSGTQGKTSWASTPKLAEYVDRARIRDVDFEAMRDEAEELAQWKYELVESAFGGTIPKIEVSWSEYLDNEEYKDWDIQKKRDAYHAQPALVQTAGLRDRVKRLYFSEKEQDMLRWLDISDYQDSKEDFIRKAGDSSFSTFALLKDGVWYERGEMGWWACVSDEKEESDWNAEFSKLVENLPEDTLISVYDCHI